MTVYYNIPECDGSPPWKQGWLWLSLCVCVLAMAGILSWHHLYLYNHPGHSLSSGESSWDQASIYLFISFCLAFSPPAHGCVWQSVTPVMDEFEHNLRLLHGPGSLAVRGFVSALWSHRLVLLECTLSHSEGVLLQWKYKCFAHFKKRRDLIGWSAKPSGLYKCVLHPCGNTSRL